MSDGDGYGRKWDYRVLSEINTCPDEMPGRRHLTICKVHYRWHPMTWPNPIDDDVVEIEEVEPEGYTTEELMVCLSRMQTALDKPPLIRSEWKKFIMKTHKVFP